LKITINIKYKILNGTCPRTPERTTEGQHRDTNNNDNNIYLYLLNKYRVENRNQFSEYMKKVRELKEDEKWNELDGTMQQKLLSVL